MGEHIKRLNRELKFKGKIIDFYQDTIEVDGDHTVVWDFIKHKGAAAVVPVTEDGKILMVRQYRNALDRYTLEIPAGALDAEDEPGLVCASRELEEETGYRSENLEWLITLRTTVAFCNERIEVYVAKNLIPSKQHLDEDEFIDLKAYSMDELKNKIFTGEIEDAKTVASLMAYAVKYHDNHNTPAYNEISKKYTSTVHCKTGGSMKIFHTRKQFPCFFYAGVFARSHLCEFYSEKVRGRSGIFSDYFSESVPGCTDRCAGISLVSAAAPHCSVSCVDGSFFY